MSRDFTSVSPSAKLLLFLKSFTAIPFAKEAAHLLFDEEEIKQGRDNLPSKASFGRLLHFENRYWSVSRLMNETGINNILEISSGFSFRGLDKVLHENVFYIDTDLPDLIADKKIILEELLPDKANMKGTLLTEPLNALDQNAFSGLISRFPPGPVCIINEGLLVYLNMDEKEKLASIIQFILKDRGGCWITADIYIKNEDISKEGDYGQYEHQLRQFRAMHNIEENKFESFETAERFFDKCGFQVNEIDVVDVDRLSSLRFVAGKMEMTEDAVKQWMKGRQTWMLEVKE